MMNTSWEDEQRRTAGGRVGEGDDLLLSPGLELRSRFRVFQIIMILQS